MAHLIDRVSCNTCVIHINTPTLTFAAGDALAFDFGTALPDALPLVAPFAASAAGAAAGLLFGTPPKNLRMSCEINANRWDVSNQRKAKGGGRQ